MYGKLILKVNLKVLTGLHIGGSNAYAAIGAVDSPVIVDAATQKPIIPGSSLKGKMRTLLVRSIIKDVSLLGKPDDDPKEVKDLFGSSAPIHAARLQFADAYVVNNDEFTEVGLTEVKFENTLDRKTGMANPRQIERVNRGVKFEVQIAYTIENPSEIERDLQNLAKAMKLLQIDYLGGHGSRGSGRITFEGVRILSFSYEVDSEHYSKWQTIFEDVENYELLPI